MRYFVTLLLLLFPALACANTVIEYDPPGERQDGTPLPAEEIDYHTLWCGPTEQGPFNPIHQFNGTAQRIELVLGQRWGVLADIPLEVLPAGDHWCYILATDTDGQEGEPTEVRQVSVLDPLPAPPAAGVIVDVMVRGE